MIIRVLDSEGNVNHDCLELGCEVSWDGYVLVDQLDIPEHREVGGRVVPAATLKRGERVPNAGGVPPHFTQVTDSVVRLKTREEMSR